MQKERRRDFRRFIHGRATCSTLRDHFPGARGTAHLTDMIAREERADGIPRRS